MKIDEYNLLMSIPQDINLKRREYIIEKWTKRGWYEKGLLTDKFTEEFNRIRELAAHKEDYMDKLDGHVVIITFINQSQSIGILEDHGDNGWYFYTTNSCRYDSPWYVTRKEIAYLEQHPQPAKIWKKMNYLFWKHRKTQDRFHKQITTMSHGTACDYSRASEGIFTHSHPLGKIGDCFPCCQCKSLQ